MDPSNLQFNKGHKLEAAAREASTGIRLMLIGLLAAACSLGLNLAASAGIVPATVGGLGVIFLWVVSLFGIYGAYLAANALNYPGAATIAIVLGLFLPFVKLAIWIVLLSFSLNLIRQAGFRVSLFGPLQKRVTA